MPLNKIPKTKNIPDDIELSLTPVGGNTPPASGRYYFKCLCTMNCEVKSLDQLTHLMLVCGWAVWALYLKGFALEKMLPGGKLLIYTDDQDLAEKYCTTP